MDSKGKAVLNELERILKDLDLLQRRNSSVSYSFDFSKIRGDTYLEYWKSYYRENWYDFQLKDLSLISFSDSSNDPFSFLYLGCPIDCVTEENYYNSSLYCEDTGFVPYDEYIATCRILENIAYLRYDHSPKQYKEGIHPANHLHVGYGQTCRIGSYYHLDMMTFSSLVIRQFYPEKWKIVLDDPNKYKRIFDAKSSLATISGNHYGAHDEKRDFYLK